MTTTYKSKYWGDYYGTFGPDFANQVPGPISDIDLPTIFNDSTFKFGKTLFRILQKEGDVENTVFYFPDESTVITGDVAFDHYHPWLLDGERQGTLSAWKSSIESIQSLGATTVIAGHYGTDSGEVVAAGLQKPGALQSTHDYISLYQSFMAANPIATPSQILKALTDKFPAADGNSQFIAALSAGILTLEDAYAATLKVDPSQAPKDPTSPAVLELYTVGENGKLTLKPSIATA